jgi:hypothetical protein
MIFSNFKILHHNSAYPNPYAATVRILRLNPAETHSLRLPQNP